jgi:hypothetical protein
MPKRLTIRENILIFTIVGYFAWVAHILFGIKLDLLDFGPTKKVEYTDFALVSLLPSLLSVLYLNYKKEDKYLLYVFLWTVLSFLIEFLFSTAGYMKHTEWKMWYSIPVYFVAYSMLHWFNKHVLRKV